MFDVSPEVAVIGVFMTLFALGAFMGMDIPICRWLGKVPESGKTNRENLDFQVRRVKDVDPSDTFSAN